MKTKIILFIGAVAVITLSFTFVTIETPAHKSVQTNQEMANTSSQIGGLVSDAVVK